jgi:inorganic triphosphatase YgiF
MRTAHLAEATPLRTQPARPGLWRGPAARRISPRVLSAGARADEAFRVIARACLERLRLSGERLARTGDADALHQVRVALRQLRSALTIFAPVLADERIARLRDELKWLSSTLNDARDLDVLIARMPQPPAALVEAREEASTDGMAALDSARSRRLLAELERVAAGQSRLADHAAAPAPPAA